MDHEKYIKMGIREKNISIPEKLLKEYEEKSGCKIDEITIVCYIAHKYNFDARTEPDKLSQLSDEEVSNLVIENLKDEISVFTK